MACGTERSRRVWPIGLDSDEDDDDDDDNDDDSCNNDRQRWAALNLLVDGAVASGHRPGIQIRQQPSTRKQDVPINKAGCTY